MILLTDSVTMFSAIIKHIYISHDPATTNFDARTLAQIFDLDLVVHRLRLPHHRLMLISMCMYIVCFVGGWAGM